MTNAFVITGTVRSIERRTSAKGKEYAVLLLDKPGYQNTVTTYEVTFFGKSLGAADTCQEGQSVLITGELGSRTSQDGRFHNASLAGQAIFPQEAPGQRQQTFQQPRQQQGYQPRQQQPQYQSPTGPEPDMPF